MVHLKHPIWECDYEEHMFTHSYAISGGKVALSESDEVGLQYLLNLGYERVEDAALGE